MKRQSLASRAWLKETQKRLKDRKTEHSRGAFSLVGTGRGPGRLAGWRAGRLAGAPPYCCSPMLAPFVLFLYPFCRCFTARGAGTGTPRPSAVRRLVRPVSQCPACSDLLSQEGNGRTSFPACRRSSQPAASCSRDQAHRAGTLGRTFGPAWVCGLGSSLNAASGEFCARSGRDSSISRWPCQVEEFRGARGTPHLCTPARSYRIVG